MRTFLSSEMHFCRWEVYMSFRSRRYFMLPKCVSHQEWAFERGIVHKYYFCKSKACFDNQKRALSSKNRHLRCAMFEVKCVYFRDKSDVSILSNALFRYEVCFIKQKRLFCMLKRFLNLKSLYQNVFFER